jgi:acetyltransferase-like isoleucine patch superfamily enzyme
VWIGFGAIILSGSRIGRGSVIGAGCVVVGDVEPYSIMVSPKARLLRHRFEGQEALDHDASLGFNAPDKPSEL